MSTATATAPAPAKAASAPAAPPAKGKKKLILIGGVALLVLALAAVGAVLMLKKRQQAAADGDGGTAAPAAEAKHEPEAPPTFVPLDPFTVNLADRDAERYAQVGITLEVTDAKVAEEIKAFMPAIRNNVLMAIADRTAAEIASREGKALLAARIRRETLRALGYALPPETGAAGEAASAADHGGRKPSKDSALPVKAVQFSNFIIQ